MAKISVKEEEKLIHTINDLKMASQSWYTMSLRDRRDIFDELIDYIDVNFENDGIQIAVLELLKKITSLSETGTVPTFESN